jgi:hypothetical protein
MVCVSVKKSQWLNNIDTIIIYIFDPDLRFMTQKSEGGLLMIHVNQHVLKIEVYVQATN